MTDKYTRIARIYPAVLCSLPIFVLNFFLLKGYIGGFIDSLAAVAWAGGSISLSVVLTFLFGQLGRFIGKELYEKTHFKDELHMPTTNLLLHSNTSYSADHKAMIYEKISADFRRVLFTKEREAGDLDGARKVIVEAVSLIRAKVRDGNLVVKHNREYGFARNFIGGSVIAVAVSIANLLIFGTWFPNPIAYQISLFLALAYLFAMMMSGFVMRRYGVLYAKVLIQEYLLT